MMATSFLKNVARLCPVCDSTRGEVLHTQRFVLPEGHPLAAGYAVVGCPQGGFAYADTAAGQREYDEFYARLSKYTDNKTSTGGGLAAWDADRLRHTAQDIARVIPRRDSHIVDIGCANGGLLQSLRDLGYSNLCGIDPAPACVAQAAQVSGAVTYSGSLSNIPAEAGVFDVIILSHVLEHVKDLRPALEGLEPFLKPNASLYVETPDASRYAEFVFAPFQDFNTEHINHFSVAGMTNLLHCCGFAPFESGTKDILSAPDMPYPALFAFARRISGSPVIASKDVELKSRLLEYIALSQQVMDEIEARLKTVLAQDLEVIVWGTGQLAMKLLAETSLAQARIEAFVDGNPLYHGQRLQGIPIVAPEEIGASNHPILVTSILHHRAIAEKIRQLHLPNPIIALRTI